jgi:hypothetical protein
MVKKIVIGVALLVASLARPASADPVTCLGGLSQCTIGEFLYGLDPVNPDNGTMFTVENYSAFTLTEGEDFTGMNLQLFSGGTPVPVPCVPDGTLSPTCDLGSLSSVDILYQTPWDFSGLSFDSAMLSFVFSLPGTISFTDVNNPLNTVNSLMFGETNSVEDAWITFTPESQSVPEPSTLLLLGSGGAVLAAATRWRRRAPERTC